MEFENLPMPADIMPSAICEACAAAAIFHRPTRTAAAFCTHSQTGAVYPLGGSWFLIEGLDVDRFRAGLVRALMRAQLLGDVAAAVEQFATDEARHETKH